MGPQPLASLSQTAIDRGTLLGFVATVWLDKVIHGASANKSLRIHVFTGAFPTTSTAQNFQ